MRTVWLGSRKLKAQLESENRAATLMVQTDQDAAVVVEVLDTARAFGLTDLAIGTYASP